MHMGSRGTARSGVFPLMSAPWMSGPLDRFIYQHEKTKFFKFTT